jgi:hypothetical protein
MGTIVKTEEVSLWQKTSFNLKLRKLQMYLKYLADQQKSKSDRKTETRNFEARTFKYTTPLISRLLSSEPISAGQKQSNIRTLTISHIIFPFDLDYSSKTDVFTKEHVLRD